MTPPSLKTSIYLDPDTQALLSARETGPGTRSEVIRVCIERYAEICRRERPELSATEWRVIFNALDERWLAGGHSPIHVPAAVADSGHRHVTGMRLEIEALGKRLGELFFAELVAVVDEAERHWAEQRRT